MFGARTVCWGGGFEALAPVFAKISGDFGTSERVQDTAVEPRLFRCRRFARHAGLGGGLRAGIAARIWPKMPPDTATPASWNVILRAWRTTRAPILIKRLWRLVRDQLPSRPKTSQTVRVPQRPRLASKTRLIVFLPKGTRFGLCACVGIGKIQIYYEAYRANGITAALSWPVTNWPHFSMRMRRFSKRSDRA